MTGLFQAIAEVAGLARGLTDPAKRRESYELLLDKKSKKALEIAEKTYHKVDEFLYELRPFIKDNDKAQFLVKRFTRNYRYSREQFFRND